MADATDDAGFRTEVRRFIAERAPALRFRDGLRVPRHADEERAIRAWFHDLYHAGYLGAGWPPEWGGRPDHHPTRDLILMEELFRARAYRPLDQVLFAGQAILDFGTADQQHEYLPRIRSGEHIWCQLFSEPDAGSDLAGLRTHADRDGAAFVVNGQKVWSTDAHWADMGILLARTDRGAERHAGLTAFVVPMDLPGIDVQPIREMTGAAEFCAVFLDGLRLGEEHVLGEVDGGWSVITSGLASERAFVGANAVQLQMMFEDLVELARCGRLPDGSRLLDHEDVQLRLAEALADVEAVRLIVHDTVSRIVDDDDHPSDGAFAKLAYTERNVALCELALELLADASSLDEPGPAVADRWHDAFLWSRAITIAGGASEILRGLIGRQLLGLPRA
jgi:alkylation response protein AidB-like acyl-CoA dehydrogenase